MRVCMFIAERAMIDSPADTCVTELDCLFPAAFCAVLCPSLHATRHAHASRTSPLRGCLWHPLRGWWPLLQCAGYRRHEFPPNAGEEGHLPRHESESRGFERGAYAGGGCTSRPPPPRCALSPRRGAPPNAHAPQLQRTARSMFKAPVHTPLCAGTPRVAAGCQGGLSSAAAGSSAPARRVRARSCRGRCPPPVVRRDLRAVRGRPSPRLACEHVCARRPGDGKVLSEVS